MISGVFLISGVGTAASGVGLVIGGGLAALGLAFLPVATMIGAIHGAANSLDENVVDDAVLAIRAAMVHREFPRGVAEAILHFSCSRGISVEELASGAPPDGFDTLITVEPTQLVFQGPYEVDPEVSVHLLQTVTLRRVSDGKELHRMQLAREGGGKAKFLDLAKDGAKMLLESFERTDVSMGERFADCLFIQPPSPPRLPYLDRYGRMVNP